ncbi:MAG TPA: LysR family transcriptional regulator [Candidatus Sulfotelmatobacter sp.]|nr:LysR family transcriptional regulator [Candidatus Sulfotelmatobacter sp.]
MIMDIDEIRAFVSIVQLGGFTRAADRLHRSQPAVSRRIGLIERELGAPLLERVRGRVAPTAAGRAFLPFAEAVLSALEDGRQAVRAALGDGGGPVSLALVGTLADTHIVAVLRKFAQRSKSIELDLRTATSQEVSDLVRRGEVTLGLRYFHDERGDLNSRVVGAEAMRVICAPDHPSAGKRMTRRRIAAERWVGFPAARGRESFGKVLERQLAAAGLDDAKITVIDSLTAQKRLVEAGFGIALVPESSVRDELKLGSLRELDLPSLRTTVPVALVHRRNGYLSPAVRALIALIGDAAARLSGRPAGRRPGRR